jgi:hypothetical protein
MTVGSSGKEGRTSSGFVVGSMLEGEVFVRPVPSVGPAPGCVSPQAATSTMVATIRAALTAGTRSTDSSVAQALEN